MRIPEFLIDLIAGEITPASHLARLLLGGHAVSALTRESCARAEFARWAKYEVERHENSRRRVQRDV